MVKWCLTRLFIIAVSSYFPHLVFGQHIEASNLLQFVANTGQWNDQVAYRADIPSGQLYIEKDRILLDFVSEDDLQSHLHHPWASDKPPNTKIRYHAYEMRFIGANPNVDLVGQDKQDFYFNYFLGNDSKKWAAKIHPEMVVVYKNLYPNIDLRLYGSGEQLKYDIVVHPGGNPNDVIIEYNGLDKIELRGASLFLRTSVMKIIEEAPYSFQESASGRKEVSCHYKLINNRLQFQISGDFDHSKDLIIDPVIVFSTFSGSTANNFGFSATFDSKGFLYSGSISFSNGYPTTLGAYQTTTSGGTVDITISKYNLTGTARVWASYIGGTANELPHSLVVDEFDQLFLYGTTGSSNYPTSPTAYSNTFMGGPAFAPPGIGVSFPAGTDIFISKFSADGTTLLASTFVGGTLNDGLNTDPDTKYNYADEIRGEIIIDSDNNVFVASTSSSLDFPVSPTSFQPGFAGGAHDAVVFRMTSNLSTLTWASFFGGTKDDAAYAIALDTLENLFITGGTNSTDLVTTPTALSPGYQGGRTDAFIAHIDRDGNSLFRASYWGTSTYDQAFMVETDRFNNVYLLGQTEVTDSSLIHNAGYAVAGGGQFISKMTGELDSLIWSTAFGTGGGVVNISPTAMLVDYCNKIYLSGWGGTVNRAPFTPNNNAGFTTGMDITPGAFQSTTDGSDFYLMVLEDDASGLVYSTFYGGPISPEHVDGGTSRFDRGGKVYHCVCAGCQNNDDFPTTPGAVSATNNSTGCNAAVFKIDFELPLAVAEFSTSNTCLPDSTYFTNYSVNAFTYEWDFGDGNTSNAVDPVHLYAGPGAYDVKLIVRNNLTCNFADSLVRQILVLSDSVFNLPTANICEGESVPIGVLGSPNPLITFKWIPTTNLSDTLIPNPTASPSVDTRYTLLIQDTLCVDSVIQFVNVHTYATANAGSDFQICAGTNITLGGGGNGLDGYAYTWNDTVANGNVAAGLVSYSFTPLTSLNYELIVLDSSGMCGDTDQVFVDVIAVPNADAGVDKTRCTGSVIQIGGSTNGPNGYLYHWSNSPGIWPVANGEAIRIFSPASSANYWLYVEDSTGLCVDSDDVYVNVVQSPTANAGNNMSICSGSATNIGGSGNTLNGYDFSWNNGGGSGTVAAGLVSTSVSPMVTTEFLLIVEDTTGKCMARDSVIVTVVALPVADPGPTQTICGGQVANIGGVTNSQNGYNFLWNPGAIAGVVAAGSAPASVSPTDTTWYILTLTDPGGMCTDRDSVLVLVIPAPLARAGVDREVCVGNSATIGGTGNLQEGYPFSWSAGAGSGVVTGGSVSASVSPLVSTTYTLTVQDPSLNCSSTDNVRVTVYELPIADAGSAINICRGDTAYFGGNGNLYDGYSYSWTSAAGSGIVSAGAAPGMASPIDTTLYTLTVSSPSNLCSDISQVQVNVSYIDMAAIPDRMICDGTTTTLTANTFGLGDTYHWSLDRSHTGVSLNNPTSSPTIAVAPSVPTMYYVSAENNGCSIYDSVFVNIASFQVGLATDTLLCLGDTIELVANNNIPSDPLVFDWSPDAMIISGDGTNAILVSPAITTTYTVSTVNSASCLIQHKVTVVVSMLPAFLIHTNTLDDTIASGNSTVISVDDIGGYEFTWVPPLGLDNPDSTSTVASPPATMDYFATIEEGHCIKSEPVHIFVYEGTCGEPDIFVPKAFTPDNNNMNDRLYVRATNIQQLDFQFMIYNRWGELVFKTENIEEGWDGTHRGVIAEPGVFVYHLRATCDNDERYFGKGNITLIR